MADAVWAAVGILACAFGLWAALLVWTSKRDGWPRR